MQQKTVNNMNSTVGVSGYNKYWRLPNAETRAQDRHVMDWAQFTRNRQINGKTVAAQHHIDQICYQLNLG